MAIDISSSLKDLPNNFSDDQANPDDVIYNLQRLIGYFNGQE